jgi:hypothetical protein
LQAVRDVLLLLTVRDSERKNPVSSRNAEGDERDMMRGWPFDERPGSDAPRQPQRQGDKRHYID